MCTQFKEKELQFLYIFTHTKKKFIHDQQCETPRLILYLLILQ